MGQTCPNCKKGKLVFYDGGFEHEPRYVCNNCNAFWEDGVYQGILNNKDSFGGVF